MILMNIKPNICNIVHKVTFRLFAFAITLFYNLWYNIKIINMPVKNSNILLSWSTKSVSFEYLWNWLICFFYEGVSSHGSHYHYQASGHDSRLFIELLLLYKQCKVLSEIIKNYWQCMVFKNGCSNNKDQSNGPSLSNELVAKPDKKILGNHRFTTTLSEFFYFWKTVKHLHSIKCKMLKCCLKQNKGNTMQNTALSWQIPFSNQKIKLLLIFYCYDSFWLKVVFSKAYWLAPKPCIQGFLGLIPVKTSKFSDHFSLSKAFQ